MGQLLAAGLLLDRDRGGKPPIFDGRVQRWRVAGEDKEWRGWSRLKEWVSARGNVYLVGVFGCWHGNDPGQRKIDLPPPDPNLTKEQTAARREEAKAVADAARVLAKQADEDRKIEARQAARWAAAVWAHAKPCAGHEYLTRKGIQPHGLRQLDSLEGLQVEGVDEANWWRLTQACPAGHPALIVPMHDVSGQVCGVQFIYGRGHPRKTKTGRDKEFWPSGMAMGGTFGVIGPLYREGIAALGEGFGTLASIAEATGLTAIYAFSANNLAKAAKEIRKACPRLKLLVTADDDYLTDGNPGATAAAQVAAQVAECAWIKPDFTGPDGADLRAGKKLSDFNDLAALAGNTLPLARQINAKLDALGWRDANAARDISQRGVGETSVEDMAPRLSIEDAVRRFIGTYGFGGKVLFDAAERRLVHKDDVLNLLPSHGWQTLKDHPAWRVVRDSEIGFDPTQADPGIKCNLFGGWPTVPVPGQCDALLDLLRYQCSLEPNVEDAYWWILCWLAYPIQHPGAKMHSAIVVHGPQGTGKSRFFEAYGRIYGDYFRVIGQDALEDKFNSDWAEKKLFIIGDEILAKAEMFQVKNRLKGFITSETIRVNPKNIAAHTERNCMNIVFLSNERMPLVLENDDRRHMVLWVPPKLDDSFYAEVTAEIQAGGVAALHHYLATLDLGGFKPWTRPPMTRAKEDLVQLGRSSEERFAIEWRRGEVEAADGAAIPFCPCLGSTLFKVYEKWCERTGERRRPMSHFINYLGKRHGWTAGKSTPTWQTLIDCTVKNRKMVIPSPADMQAASRDAPPGSDQAQHARRDGEDTAEWLTRCFFAFEQAAGIAP